MAKLCQKLGKSGFLAYFGRKLAVLATFSDIWTLFCPLFTLISMGIGHWANQVISLFDPLWEGATPLNLLGYKKPSIWGLILGCSRGLIEFSYCSGIVYQFNLKISFLLTFFSNDTKFFNKFMPFAIFLSCQTTQSILGKMKRYLDSTKVLTNFA